MNENKIKVSISSDKIYEVPEKILMLSTYVNAMHKDFPDEIIPMIGPLKNFDTLLNWIAVIPETNSLDDEFYFIVDKDCKYFDYYFEDLNLRDKIELLNFSINNQFIILSNCVAKRLSLFSITYKNNKFYIGNNEISLTAALMITKFGLTTVNIINYPKNLLKNFKYNPLFDKRFDKYFNIETLIFKSVNDVYETNKNIILYYGSKCLEKQNYKVIHKILSGSDLNRKLKPEVIDSFIVSNIKIVKKYLLKHHEALYFEIFETYRKNLDVCKAMKNCLTDFIVFDRLKPDLIYDCFSTSFLKSSYEIPKDVFKIDDFTFSNSLKLKYINIPNNISSIGFGAFSYCTKLTEIDLPYTIDILPRNFLCGCVNLKYVNQCGQKNSIPYVKTIENNAFQYCSKLESLQISNVENLDITAFDRCGLTSLTLSNNIKDLNTYRDEINDLTNLRCLKVSSNHLPVILKINHNIDVYCDDILTSSQIECIQQNKLINFINNQNLIVSNKSIIPDFITKIENDCFKNCKSLTLINLIGVKELGNAVFKNCENLQFVSLPNLNKIPNNCFENCIKLNNISLPSTVEEIGVSSFANCKKLTSIDVKCVSFFSKQCFENCSSLTSIALSSDVKSIPAGFLKNCNIQHFAVPESVMFINKGAFEGCTKLKDIKFMSDKCAKLGEYAFESCSSLTSITLSNSIKSIPVNCFLNCYKLKEISRIEGNKIYQNELPMCVKTVEDSAFEECRSIENLNLNNVEEIKSLSFNGCISLINLKHKASKISKNAFTNCISLKRL